MPESTIVVLLSALTGLIFLLLVLVIGISRCLLRIERRLAEMSGRLESGESAPSHGETSAGGAFETFLNENPERRKLPKGEQFAEYRRWRQEKGMNWSNS